MKRRVGFVLVAGLALLMTASVALAGDTGPYLIGAWEDDGETIYTDFIIVNPTTLQLDVYAAFFDNDGFFLPGRCFKKTLNPNAKWYIPGAALGLSGFDSVGTAKFIAMAKGKRAYDTYAVVGGYQNRWIFEMTSSQSDLKGVTINTYTLGEFNNILSKPCTEWVIREQ